MQAQLNNPRDFREDGCIKRNSFEKNDDYLDFFEYKGISSLHRSYYDEGSSIQTAEDFIDYLDLDSEYTFRHQSTINVNGKSISKF